MNTIVRIIVVLSVTLLVGCSNSVQRLELDSLPQPPAEKGLVYFFREKAFQGSAVTFGVYDGSDKIGVLQAGTFFFIEAEPGLHTYSAKTEVSDRLHVVVEAGRSHFIEGSVRLGLFVGQPELRLVNETEGKVAVEGLRPIVWTR